MRSNKLLLAMAGALTLVSAPLFADDGMLLKRNMSQQEADLYACPSHGEHAFTKLMNFRVPSQAASGDLVEIEYINVDGTLVDTLLTAKPIISVYVFGPVTVPEGAEGFQGHGRRDVYTSVSLDDGTTWKTTNLSGTGHLTAFDTATSDAPPTYLPLLGEDCDEIPLDWNSDVYDALPEDEHASLSTGQGAGDMLASLDTVKDSSAQAIEIAPVISSATWTDVNTTFGRVAVAGDGVAPRDLVSIISITYDAETNPIESLLFRVRADRDGAFSQTRSVPVDQAPCSVVAEVDGIRSEAVTVEGSPAEPCGRETTTEYPGDNNNVFHAVAQNKILVAWQSRFCSAGMPAYALDDATKDEIAAYLEIDREADLYFEDLFAVAGNQGWIDYNTEGFPQVGVVPFNCLWTARGVVREDPDNDGVTEVVWYKPERITSGRRDLTRIETQCVAGAGCAITWQEDPVGLRPGEGEGPGTGWAGATTNSQTDVWYSYLPWEHFDTVNSDGTPVLLSEYTGDTKPGAYVPFAVPVRLTNNARCNVPVTGLEETYCNYDVAEAYGLKDYCAETTDIPLGPQNTLTPVCVADSDGDGTADLVNVANTAASRPRLNLRPRDTDGDGVTDDAYVIMVLEEDKGLGAYGYLNDEEWTGNLEDTGTMCGEDPDANPDDNCVKADVGKNTFYFSFAMGDASSSDSEDEIGLLDWVVSQGAQINRPEVNWITGTYYPPMDTADMWDFGEYNYLIFNTQIARRSAMMSQSIAKAEASTSGLLAMPLFKEGIMNQGGPADIQAVRVMADTFSQTDDNPYRPENLVCDNLYFDDGSNPYYPYGLCMLPTINLSGMTPFECEPQGLLSDGVCADLDLTCTDDANFGQLCSTEVDPEDQQTFDKLLSWYECPGSNATSTQGMPDCGIDGTSSPSVLQSNLDDAAWYMPYDVSKAHRGFLDGDFVMMLYAKSPNWKLNTVGHDRYELYQRRSFDGGETFTVTPGSFSASNGETYSGSGTTTCETWRKSADAGDDEDELHNCTTYAAGEPEQSRNMSQLKAMAFTILDPRYTPTMATMTDFSDTLLDDYGDIFIYDPLYETIGDLESSDIRRPDRHFIVFESGDNTTVAVGEAEPLNLDYGRAFNFGDHFQVWYDEILDGDVIDDNTSCYPSDPHDLDVPDEVVGTGFCNEFDELEGSQTALSEEASVGSSAAGDFLYAVWGQINLDLDGEEIDGNSEFRRVWWIDGWISDSAYEPGQGTP